jgi:hypothetical protein
MAAARLFTCAGTSRVFTRLLLAIVTVLFVFGGFSVIFAGPMAVIIFVAINKIYVRDSLGERTVLPGEDKAKS